jgi:hypothetical protein
MGGKCVNEITVCNNAGDGEIRGRLICDDTCVGKQDAEAEEHQG